MEVGPDPETIDPALNSASDGNIMIIHLFEPLLNMDKDNNIIGGMAETWDVSEDGLTYTFHLRQSKWSDGTELTANDFVYSWNRAANPMTASDYSYLYDGLIAKNEVANEMVANPEYDAEPLLLPKPPVKSTPSPRKLTARLLWLLRLPTRSWSALRLPPTTPDRHPVSPCPYFLSLVRFPHLLPRAAGCC